jgi:hypothetical protein
MANNGTYPRMNKQFGTYKDRKSDEESDMDFNVAKERKPTDASSRRPKGSE